MKRTSGARKLNEPSIAEFAVEDSSKWHWLHSSSLFVVANIAAGILNYCFQVLASKALSAGEFSSLYGWFADLAVFFMIGGILQYASIFFPVRRNFLRQAIIGINVVCAVATAAWLQSPSGQGIDRAIIIVASATFFGWLMGQVQHRKMFMTIGAANILIASTKLAIVLVPFLGTAEKYRFAMFASYLPALWMMSILVWNSSAAVALPVRKKFAWSLLAAPLALSISGAMIPQLDMILMSRIQPQSVFDDFARASIFYKGFYFLFLILAQWLLPHQIHGQWKYAKNKIPRLWIATGAVSASAILAISSPLIIEYVLKWDRSPSVEMIFLSCLNMSLLTWIYLLIQSACASSRIRTAAIGIAVLSLEAALQYVLHSSSNGYFAIGISSQAALIWLLTRPQIS